MSIVLTRGAEKTSINSKLKALGEGEEAKFAVVATEGLLSQDNHAKREEIIQGSRYSKELKEHLAELQIWSRQDADCCALAGPPGAHLAGSTDLGRVFRDDGFWVKPSRVVRLFIKIICGIMFFFFFRTAILEMHIFQVESTWGNIINLFFINALILLLKLLIFYRIEIKICKLQSNVPDFPTINDVVINFQYRSYKISTTC